MIYIARLHVIMCKPLFKAARCILRPGSQVFLYFRPGTYMNQTYSASEMQFKTHIKYPVLYICSCISGFQADCLGLQVQDEKKHKAINS